MLDRNPETLALFLDQVWVHLDQHGREYFNDEARVDIIVASLEGEAAEWVSILHDEGHPELANLDAFLYKLRAQFVDPTQTRQVESEVCNIK
ncbi:hypothetical protein NXF25_013945 [Crotalus adamanteus]|uniref:DUF4939 domain-containing protein n=1 Tax=Crotalus adamanteus TaxID=8729 RepID=A0AAW1BB90_CROAD